MMDATATRELQSLRTELTDILEGAVRRVTEHRYHRALRDGSLPAAVHTHFARQDLHLLPAYGRAHARAAGVADRPGPARFLGRMAAICLDNAAADERALAGAGGSGADAAPIAPTTLSYASFLAAAAATSFAAALGALLPSAYLQLYVNDDLLARHDPASRYAEVIRTSHPGDEYRLMVGEFVDLVVEFGERRCAAERAELLRHLRYATHYEWAFVEAAWRLEGWPS